MNRNDKEIRWSLNEKENQFDIRSLLKEYIKYIHPLQNQVQERCHWNEKGFKIHRNLYNQNKDDLTTPTKNDLLFQLTESEYGIAFAYWFVKHFGFYLKHHIIIQRKISNIDYQNSNDESIYRNFMEHLINDHEEKNRFLDLFNCYEVCQLLLSSLIITKKDNKDYMVINSPRFPINVQKRMKQSCCYVESKSKKRKNK